MGKKTVERVEIDRKVEEHSTALQYYSAAVAYFQSASLLLNSSRQDGVGIAFMPILTLLGIGYELAFKAWKRSKNRKIDSMKGHDLLKLKSECIDDEIPFDLDAVAINIRDKVDSDFFGSLVRQQLQGISFEVHFYNLNAMYGRYPNLARYPVSQRAPLIDVNLLCAVGHALCKAIHPSCIKSTSLVAQ